MGKVNDSVNLVKSALDVKVALATAEDKEKLADAKLALADLKELIADQKIEINELIKKANLEKSLEFIDGEYWTKKDDGSKDGPFCHYCKDVEGRMVRKTRRYCSQCISKNRHE